VTILLKSPCEFLTVEPSISAIIHSAENATKTSNSVGTSLLKDNEDLIKDSIGGLSGDTENWIDIRAITTSTSGESSCKLLII